MNAAEITYLPNISANSLFDLLSNLVRFTRELFGAIFRDLGNGGLSRIPIARTILVELCRGRS